MKTNLRRYLLLGALSAIVGVSVVGYAVYARHELRRHQQAVPPVPVVGPEHRGEFQNDSYLVFRNNALGPGYGCLSIVPLGDPGQARIITQLPCDRVHATAASGLALQASRGVFTTYKASVFDADLNVKATFKLAGVPSRTRLSPDGHYAASTVFVSGDSYNSGGFSTRTVVYDLRSSSLLGDLEDYAVEKDGLPFKRVDFNYWGVTFVPGSDEFFATLGTGGVFYLVRGSISKRQIRVLRDEVECPSLSPDGRRIAFKWRTRENGRLIWRLRVLDLASGEITTVNEERSVDDQAEWLDDRRVLYSLPRNVAGTGASDIWVAPANGSGVPSLFVSDASSPSVVRSGNAALAPR